ncbi:MAG: helix-turn-helix transcriptional regulator [Gemmataceae bacterium]
MSIVTQFGKFVREGRKALGLTLRDFCRRNGLDPGNVSRLERGLSPPPQSAEALTSLGKALKLQPGTDLWNRLFELAAAETGRIPGGLLKEETAVARLPDLLRQLRTGPGHRNWVTAASLEEWAKTLDARETLPQLVRRLIHATGKGVSRLSFPSGEQIQRPDVDGVVEAADADAFVPGGLSFWELSADGDPKAKAERDFEKRRKEPLGVEKRKTTYVVVTPRKFQTRREWARAKSKLRVWNEVRVYDSATLEEWLERAAGVDVWLAERLGLKPAGVTSIDWYWENLQALTDPTLKRDVFLASREEQLDDFKEWLAGPPGAVVIETRSPAEAVDFVVAACLELGEGGELAARAVIVESRDAWRSITRSESNLLLIPHPDLAVEPEMVAEAVRQRHRVVLCSGQAQPGAARILRLPRAYRLPLMKALEASGVPAPKALELSQKSGGSLTVLKRLITRFPGTTQPEWSRQPDAALLAPLLLAGSWEDTSEGDRAALERLSNRPYSDLSTTAERWLGRPDPPLTRVLSRWGLVSRDDSWFLLAPAVGLADVKRFEEVVLDVLGANDPAYELPADKRWQASLYRKVSPYTYAFRTGLAETLALLGGRPERLTHVPEAAGLAGVIVRKLLDGQSWERWASLSPQLPLLAEAAPEEFLEVADRDLDRPDSSLLKLFEQEGDPIFSSSPHTGVLWALEGLAWSQTLLPKVARALARLDERAPQGKAGNRPIRSLQAIFIPWLPQTTAPVEGRLRLLSDLARKVPGAGWRLLMSIMPDTPQSVFPIHRPAFRDWALGWREGSTNAEYWRQVTATGALLLDLAGYEVGRWKEMIDELESFAGPPQEDLIARLEKLDESMLETAERRTLTEAIRDKVGRHRKFSEADWAFPEGVITRLEEVQRRFEPDDPVSRCAWLFAPEWSVEEQVSDGAKDVTGRRRKAVEEILTARGWDGVLALAELAAEPEAAGQALAEAAPGEHEGSIVPRLLASGDEKLRRFANGYAWARFRASDWGWIEGLNTRTWSPEEVGYLARLLPFERRTWDFVKGAGPRVEEFYWRECNAFPHDKSREGISFVASELVRHRLAPKACWFLGMALHEPNVVEPALIMDALEALADLPPDMDRPFRDIHYRVHQLFQELQRGVRAGDPRIDRTRVARLEWQLLELLDGHPAEPETLHTMLSEDPQFLVGIIEMIYRPEDHPEDEGEREHSEAERARVVNAYRLLSSWRLIPGSRDDGSIEEDALFRWMHAARSLARERKLLKACDERIGNVFAHSRGEDEADGGWPRIPVRDALEEVGTDEAFRGLEIGILNKRGVYWKSPTEGGEQERSLASQYERYAEACEIEWPKTATSLRRVARSYTTDAQREDAQSLLDG